MAVQLIGIGTAVPECALAQSQVRDLFLAEPDLAPLTARLIRAAYDNSAIERRHTVIEDFAGGGGTFLDPESRVIRAPGTATRNELYARDAPKLSETAARRALHNAGVQPGEITHVVTASCTGFYAASSETSGSTRPSSASTSVSWDALQRSPHCVRPGGSASATPPRRSWCRAPRCARST